jgi:hypothetical protein
MTTAILLKYSIIVFVVLCFSILFAMSRKRLLAKFPMVAAFLCIMGLEELIALSLLFFRKELGLTIPTAYRIYFYGHWFFGALEAVLQILIIYSVFRLAMKPLQGLHQIGKIIFRWVAAVSIVVSVAISAGPHVVTSISSGYGLTAAITTATSQIQQGICVLTLCLLLFVCFATKPLGLTYRSRVFGIILGLGVLATTVLIQAARFSTTGSHSLYSPVYVFTLIGGCVSLIIWGAYIVLPEPERKLILLPTTSPFFFWNKISEALGDAPGHVAIAGFRPDMLAPAELEMLGAPSMKRIETHAERGFSAPALQSASSH